MQLKLIFLRSKSILFAREREREREEEKEREEERKRGGKEGIVSLPKEGRTIFRTGRKGVTDFLMQVI